VTTARAPDPRDDPTVLADGVRRGEPAKLARLLTLVESGDPVARETMATLGSSGARAYTIGITGAPGAGKSSLTDRLIAVLRASGDSVAVLAVDPSSPKTGGAILGDRVRMNAHATDPGVFIRSMATRGHLGGLAAAVPEAIRVLDAGGFPWILVETVGVGQVELDVAGATDTTVVVVTPGWGDGVQANKAGLLEVADVFVVNKADRAGADAAERDLIAMLELGHDPAWVPPIVQTIATTGEGVDRLWDAISAHREHELAAERLDARRRDRVHTEIRDMVRARVLARADEWSRGSEFEQYVDEQLRAGADPQRIVDELVIMLSIEGRPGRG
jgi:LAO/AO transport system kinase